MYINTLIVGLGAAVFLNSLTLHAADCSVSFDQSCLSQSYSDEQRDKAYQQRQESMEQIRRDAKAHDKAIAERQEQEARATREAERIRREEERLSIEAEKVRAIEENTRAIEGRTRAIRENTRSVEDLRRDLYR
jgi:hypothetical protein